MADRGQFPKSDGDIYYAADANIEHSPYSGIIDVNMSVSTASSSTDLSSLTNCSSIVIENIGSNTAFFRFAGTATTSDFPIRSGEKLDFKNVNFSRVDAITSINTTELNIIAKDDPNYAGYLNEYEILTINATDTSSNTSFTSTTTYKDVIIANIGSNEAYIAFGATATTSDIKINSAKTTNMGHTNLSQISGITNTGKTTTIKILGVY